VKFDDLHTFFSGSNYIPSPQRERYSAKIDGDDKLEEKNWRNVASIRPKPIKYASPANYTNMSALLTEDNDEDHLSIRSPRSVKGTFSANRNGAKYYTSTGANYSNPTGISRLFTTQTKKRCPRNFKMHNGECVSKSDLARHKMEKAEVKAMADLLRLQKTRKCPPNQRRYPDKNGSCHTPAEIAELKAMNAEAKKQAALMKKEAAEAAKVANKQAALMKKTATAAAAAARKRAAATRKVAAVAKKEAAAARKTLKNKQSKTGYSSPAPLRNRGGGGYGLPINEVYGEEGKRGMGGMFIPIILDKNNNQIQFDEIDYEQKEEVFDSLANNVYNYMLAKYGVSNYADQETEPWFDITARTGEVVFDRFDSKISPPPSKIELDHGNYLAGWDFQPLDDE
jgi:hypothetical protein